MSGNGKIEKIDLTAEAQRTQRQKQNANLVRVFVCDLCALYVQNTFTAFYYPSSSGSRGDEHSEASREHDDVRATPDRASTCHGRRGAGDNPDASCSIVRTAD
jgi:hypothetical protein